jgi:SOS response regulatory protein OraA/RecX
VKTYGLDKQVFQKQQHMNRLQTQQADTFHEQEVRRALKDAGLSDKTVGQVIQNLHKRKLNQ